MTMLALCLAPVLMICLFFMAVRFNHLFLSLLPLVLLFVLVFHYADLMEQLFFVFVRRCLIWTVLALAAAWFLTRGSSPYVRNILCAAACIAGCAVPWSLPSGRSRSLSMPRPAANPLWKPPCTAGMGADFL